jgi:hypothetical protein
MKSVTRKNEYKTFMNIFDITKKCYKLSYTDNMKTCAIFPLQYSVKYLEFQGPRKTIFFRMFSIR